MKSLREQVVVEVMDLRARVGIVRGRSIVLSIVEWRIGML